MGRLTTHVLDTMSGQPAAALCISLWRADGDRWQHIKDVVTNAHGRVDDPILDKDGMTTGVFELRFQVGAYLRTLGNELPDPAFLDVVPIRFGIADPARHYHVPLLLSAYGYATYRGS